MAIPASHSLLCKMAFGHLADVNAALDQGDVAIESFAVVLA